MPKKKGNKISMTEEEARKMAQSMGMNPPNSSSSGSKKSKKGKSSNKSKGWWNEPIRHALSAQGIQTTLEGNKDIKTDYGSVFIPSEKFNKQLKGLLKKIKSPQIKEGIKDLLHDADNYEDLKDKFITFIEDEIGHIKYKYDSQKKRNQLVNGNFKVTEDEYEELKKTKQKIEDDFSTIKTWVEDLESELDTKKNDARNEFEDYAEKTSHKISDSSKYRVKVQQKLSELVVDLNQKRADLEYGKAIKNALEDIKEDTSQLYEDAIKKNN